MIATPIVKTHLQDNCCFYDQLFLLYRNGEFYGLGQAWDLPVTPYALSVRD